jgi:hypothetical protein
VTAVRGSPSLCFSFLQDSEYSGIATFQEFKVETFGVQARTLETTVPDRIMLRTVTVLLLRFVAVLLGIVSLLCCVAT